MLIKLDRRRFKWLVLAILMPLVSLSAHAEKSVLESASQRSLQPSSVIQRFYAERDFKLAWQSGQGGLNIASVSELRGAVAASSAQGLLPADYHFAAIDRVLVNPTEYNDKVDLLLSEAWLLLASHYLSGKVDPHSLNADWFADRRAEPLEKHLQSALAESSVAASLSELLPKHADYQRLVTELARMRAVEAAGGKVEAQVRLSLGAVIKPGSEDERIPLLRQRLGVVTPLSNVLLYDEVLVNAVLTFQEVSGLQADGLVGNATVQQLNQSTTDRIDQLVANLERWRWLPDDLGERHVLVNIPAFQAYGYQAGKVDFQTDVIVGRDFRKTPVFSSKIRYLVFNPSWTVPAKIAREDKLPQLKANPAKLAAQGFAVRAADGSIKPLSTVNWNAVSASRFPYTLYQKPGKANALGRLKIMFPNQHSVYLHDTSQPELFLKSERAFSSGCIRLRQPEGMALWLFKPEAFGRNDIDRIYASSKETRRDLKKPVPVHLLYWTARPDASGKVVYYRDVYQRDASLLAALTSER